MSKQFDCTNCGLCCGPVPITQYEFKKIKREVKKMPFFLIDKLMNQERGPLECMFRDIEEDKCTIYKARPDICKMFGFYEDMVCPNNPEHATKSSSDGYKRVNRNTRKSPVAGVLSVDINWHDFK